MTAHLTTICFRSRCLLFLCLLLSISSCTPQNIADYDAVIHTEIIRVAKRVDLFWAHLLDKPANRRDYNSHKQDYLEVESELRSLVFQSEIRGVKSGSTMLANTALDLWLQDKVVHKKSNRFQDYEAKQHRQQFKRIFTAMVTGKELKKIDPVDASNPGPTP